MKRIQSTLSHYGRTLRQVVALAAVAFFLGWSSEAHAQFAYKWLAVGELHNVQSSAGATPATYQGELSAGYQWPGIYRYADNNRTDALWIATKNFTSEQGEEYPVKIAHIGPLVTGVGEMYPVKFDLISQFEPPEVFVDGIKSFDKPIVNNETDPSMKADRMIHNVINTVTGVTVDRKIKQFSQEYHDNYHIFNYTLTNTGNVDGDEEIELPNQTREGVYLTIYRRYTINKEAESVIGGGRAWGQFNMTDMIGFGMEDFEQEFDQDMRGFFSWAGYNQSFTEYNNIGASAINGGSFLPEADTVGRLTSGHFIGQVALHADQSATNTSDDPGQPSTMTVVNSEREVFSANDHTNKSLMTEEYEDVIKRGRTTPHHADIVQPPESGKSWSERMAYGLNNPSMGTIGGMAPVVAYGPYTLEPGQSVNIVFAEGAAGLSRLAAIEVGKAFKTNLQAGATESPQKVPIEFDANSDGQIGPAESMSKNMWVMTARDSLFKTFRRAKANHESGYEIPQPPMPPKEFRVTSGTDRIRLEWDTYAGESPPGGWEIYRTRSQYEGTIRENYQYELVAQLGPEATSYDDEEVTRGISYFYYIQAVGEVNNDATGMTPTGVRLKSSRYYTQTYTPAFLKRAPGAKMEDVRVVPNPYNLASAQDVRWPDQQDKIGFLNIPGECTIKIYSEIGELIETIEHTDGSGDDFWDLTTSSNQLVVSGIYMAVIQDHQSNEEVIRSFVIIR